MNKDKIVKIITESEVLNKIADDRVFGFKDHFHESEIDEEYLFDDENRLIMNECCDGYFSTKLSKEEVIELSKVFSKIAEQL